MIKKSLQELKKALIGKKLFFFDYMLFEIESLISIPHVDLIVLSGRDTTNTGQARMFSRGHIEALSNGHSLETNCGEIIYIADENETQVLTTREEILKINDYKKSLNV